MKINLSKEHLEKFKSLLKIKDDNIEISDLLLSAFQYTDFINIDELKDRVINGEKEETVIKNMILDAYEIESESLRNSFIEQVKITKCVPSNYFNSYVKLLDKIKISFEKYKLKKVTYEPYQLFALDDIEIGENYKEISKVGFFDMKFSYSALFEGTDLWMSLNPNEINTMDSTIKKVKGNVLVLGLGMGYITYMLSRKKDVKSIMVIERNKDDISLFKKYLLPLFENKNKIKIINMDAFEYINKNYNFDYIFADLWFNAEDGLECYLKLNEIEKAHNINIDYWLETSIKQMKRRYLIELIKEQIDNVPSEAYESEEEISDRIFKKLYLDTKDTKINTIEDIKELLK